MDLAKGAPALRAYSSLACEGGIGPQRGRPFGEIHFKGANRLDK